MIKDGYDFFLTKYQDEMQIKYAETGIDREMDFDLERELEKDYSSYLGHLRRLIIDIKVPDSCAIKTDAAKELRIVRSINDENLIMEALSLGVETIHRN